MPSGSKIDFGFAFVTPTGKPVKSKAKKIRALHRFFKEEGTLNDVEGVHIMARWRNPDDTGPRARMWKVTDDPGQSLEGFYNTLSGPLLAVAERKALDDYENLRESIKSAGALRRAEIAKSKSRRKAVSGVARRKSSGKSVSRDGVGKPKPKKARKKARANEARPNGTGKTVR